MLPDGETALTEWISQIRAKRNTELSGLEIMVLKYQTDRMLCHALRDRQVMQSRISELEFALTRIKEECDV